MNPEPGTNQRTDASAPAGLDRGQDRQRTALESLRRYAAVFDEQVEAIRRWSGDVRARQFPGDAEAYH